MQSHREHLKLSIQTPQKNKLLMKFWDQTKSLISGEHARIVKGGIASTLLHDSVRNDISERIINAIDPQELDIYMDFIIDGRDSDVYDNSLDNMIKAGAYTYARVDQERVLANKLLSHFYCGSLSVTSFNQVGKLVHGSVKCSLFFCEKCQNHASKVIIQETAMGQGKFVTIIDKAEKNWDTLYRTLRRNEIQYISLPMGESVYMVITKRPNKKIFQKYDFYGFKIDRGNMIVGDKIEPEAKIGTFNNKTSYPADKLHYLREHGHAKKQNGVLTGTLQDEISAEELEAILPTTSEKKEDKNEESSFTGLVPYIIHNIDHARLAPFAVAALDEHARFANTAKELHSIMSDVSGTFVFLIGKHLDDHYQEIGYKMMRFTQKDVDAFNDLHGFDRLVSDEQRETLEAMGMFVTSH